MDRAGLALFGGLTALTFGLGSWQTARFAESLQRKEAAESPRAAVELRGDGAVDTSRLVTVGPRKSPNDRDRRRGYLVYAPTRTNDALVCLGWATEQDLPAVRAALARELERGPLRCDPRNAVELGNSFAPANPVGTRRLHWASRADLLREAGLADDAVVMDALNPPSPPLVPRPAVSTTWLRPEVHLGYAATWFSLTVAGVFLTRKLVRGAAKRPA